MASIRFISRPGFAAFFFTRGQRSAGTNASGSWKFPVVWGLSYIGNRGPFGIGVNTMKTCSSCGSDLDDAFSFCPEDGAVLFESHAAPESEVAEAASSKPSTLMMCCSACAAEYPPNFEVCPLDHAPLVARTGQPHISQSKDDEPSIPAALSDGARSEPPQSETDPDSETANPPGEKAPIQFTLSYSDEATRDPSFSIAAALTAASLIIVSLVGLVLITSSLRQRRPDPAPISIADSTMSAKPQVYIATPEVALNYAEPEARPSDDSTSPGKPRDATVEKPLGVRPAVSPAPRSAGTPVTLPPVTSPPVRQPRTVSDAVQIQPHASDGLTWSAFRSHLVGSNATRTSSGLHYDLTFSLEDQTGKAQFLRSLTILTRSSSGASKSQTLPFRHRIGPTGILTFTIGVDMPGRSTVDWGGHVSMVLAGSDSVGLPFETRFAAPLRP